MSDPARRPPGDIVPYVPPAVPLPAENIPAANIPPQPASTPNTSATPVANANTIPIGVRAQRRGARGVDIHVHWADQEGEEAVAAAAAAPPSEPSDPPHPSIPAEVPAEVPSQPISANMGVPAIHVQGGAPFPVTPIPIMVTRPVMAPPPVIVMAQGFAPPSQPVFQAPAMGTGTWYRQPPYYPGTAHWRTNPPIIVNTAPAPFPVILSQPSHVIMYR